MESKKTSYIEFFVVCVLTSLYVLFAGKAFQWGILFMPLAISAKIITKENQENNLITIAASTFVGIIAFVTLSTTLSIIALSLLSLRTIAYYNPKSTHPRLLKDRDLSPFILISLVAAKIVLSLMNIEFGHYQTLQNNPNLALFLLCICLVLALIIALDQTNKAYNPLKTNVATKEKNWTNNVMTLLSHNIRTPIASLGNRVDIIKLKKSAGIEISEDDIEGLTDDRERVNSIVHSLLSKSSRSIIATKDTPESSINEALNDYVDRVKILKPEGIDFNLSSNDKIALNLALESVISNSEKYGASLIQISLETKDKEVLLTISDDGEGMDEETLERYGTPFNSAKSKNGGSGLGVYFALQLVKEAGWQWSVESELGKGTTVTIGIPKQLLIL